VYFPGIVFGLVLATGLAGAARQWRRGGGPAALPWAVATLGIVVPVAVHEYHYRYAITVIPVACVAAGLAFARPVPHAAASSTAAVTTAGIPAADAIPGSLAGAGTPSAAAAKATAPAAAPSPRSGEPDSGERTGPVPAQEPEP